jgi:hypothetical protein
VTDQDSTNPRRESSPARRWLWRVTKWTLCAVVVGFVVRRALSMTAGQDLARLRPDPLWTLAAALTYAAGWLPAVWFWRRMMHRCGSEVGAVAASRAYFCGHLGKYVPGKATVLVIRSALLKPAGCPLSVSALTATFETLITMGVGAALAVALAPQLLPEAMRDGLPAWVRWSVAHPLVPPALVLLAVAALLPVLSQLLTLLSVRMTPAGMLGGERAVRMEGRFLAAAMAVLVAGWALHGLSLGCTLRAVGGPFDLAAWPVWVGSVAASTVAGFVALFAPGGIGVREGILLEILRVQPGLTETQAVAAPLLLRVIWFVTEIAVAGLLYSCYTGQPARTDDRETSHLELSAAVPSLPRPE